MLLHRSTMTAAAREEHARELAGICACATKAFQGIASRPGGEYQPLIDARWPDGRRSFSLVPVMCQRSKTFARELMFKLVQEGACAIAYSSLGLSAEVGKGEPQPATLRNHPGAQLAMLVVYETRQGVSIAKAFVNENNGKPTLGEWSFDFGVAGFGLFANLFERAEAEHAACN